MANKRVQTNAAGQVVLKLKTPWRDGTTRLVMSPLEFMQRLVRWLDARLGRLLDCLRDERASDCCAATNSKP